jgi:hypothetical protein
MLVKDYGGEIDWNIGAFCGHDEMMFDIDKACKMACEKNGIRYVFGSISTILQGGRIPPQKNLPVSEVLSRADKYNELGIGVRLTFSSPFVTRGDLVDETSNIMLRHLDHNNQNGLTNRNGVIVMSDLLADYIRYMYPNLELISSQVKPSVEVGLGNDSAEYYNRLLDRFDIVVVNPFKIHDEQFIKNLHNHDRVEFIVNHRCLPNCPMAGRHYQLNTKLGQAIVNGDDITELQNQLAIVYNYCGSTRNSNPLLGTSMNEDEIKMLVSQGFKHFKIEGRENNIISFVRDLGDYVFNHEMFERVIHAIAGMML